MPKPVVVRKVAVANKNVPFVEIRAVQQDDYPQISQIYQEGMSTGIATFETTVPTWEQWDSKFLPVCRYVIIQEGKIAGWCALSAVSKRNVYKGVAESTIYMSEHFQQAGLGSQLLVHLIIQSELAGFWTLQAGIFPQNIPSIRLHQKCGFRHIGIREKIAQRDGLWHDNVLMERRSSL